MGGLQAYEWAVAFPHAVRRIAVVCGACRCNGLNRVFLDSLEAAPPAVRGTSGVGTDSNLTVSGIFPNAALLV